MSVGQRIREIRDRSRLSRSAFGDSVGVSGTTINNIEDDRSNPSFETISAIIDKYKVDAEWLITGKEKPIQIVEELKTDPVQSMASWMAKVEREIYLIQQKLTLHNES